MTAAERTAAIAGAWANVEQKTLRYEDARKALDHATLMLRAAMDECRALIGERHTDAPAASTAAEQWCAGNPARRTEELL